MGLELFLKYLMFMRAFREFNLYKRSLCSWFIIVFSVQSPKLSTVCYNTFIDLNFVEKASPEMLELLKEAVYSVSKSGWRFSSMPTDQNHDKVTKDLKGSGGISDLLNTTGSLERFLMSGSIVSQLINDFEGSDKVIDMDTLNHHSESKALQKQFSEDRDKTDRRIDSNWKSVCWLQRHYKS